MPSEGTSLFVQDQYGKHDAGNVFLFKDIQSTYGVLPETSINLLYCRFSRHSEQWWVEPQWKISLRVSWKSHWHLADVKSDLLAKLFWKEQYTTTIQHHVLTYFRTDQTLKGHLFEHQDNQDTWTQELSLKHPKAVSEPALQSIALSMTDFSDPWLPWLPWLRRGSVKWCVWCVETGWKICGSRQERR